MGILFLTHSHSELKPFSYYPIFSSVHSSTNLCSSVTLSFITSNSFTCQPVYLSTYITLSFIRSTLSTRPLTCVLLLPCLLLQATRPLVHLSTLFTRPLTCVLLLPCLLLQATRPLVNLVYSSTHITTYIFLGIGFLVLYLCIVIRNEGMTNGVLMKQISKFAI